VVVCFWRSYVDAVCVRACMRVQAPARTSQWPVATSCDCTPVLAATDIIACRVAAWGYHNHLVLWHAAAVSCLVAGWCRWWLSRPSFSYALPPSVAVQQRMLLVCGMGCSCVCMRQRSLSLPMFFMVVMAAHGWVFTSASILCTFPNPGP
jgi:hypothetical protein